MSYKDLVEKSTKAGYNHSIGNRILNLMKELRQKANPHSERRWVWELLQNGKDVSQDGVPFNVQVDLIEGKTQQPALEFKHNGKPFTAENITFLVEQVSTKDQVALGQSPKTIGKFGSGFLTTHLLSEKVTVQTVIMDEGEETKRCSVLLDRSPRDKPGILESIRKSLETLTALDSLPPYKEYNPQDFNTTFRYELDAKGINVAKLGLEDLMLSIPYTLVFVPEINKVDITSDFHEFKVLSEDTAEDGEITLYTVEDKQLFDPSVFTHLAVVRGTNVDIAIPVEIKVDKFFLKSLGNKIPRLFCDYPLVGSENFPFPVIINSRLFNPNDPRSHVLLNEVDDPEINQNKDIIEEAVTLYRKLLSYCAQRDFQNLYVLASFGKHMEVDWIDEHWYKAHVAEQIYLSLSTQKIIDTAAGTRIATFEDNQHRVYFPSGADPRVRKMLYDLAVVWFPNGVPREVDVGHWAAVLWPNCQRLTLKLFAEWIVGMKKLSTLGNALQKNEDVVDWLNGYYKLLNVEGNFIKNIIANEYAVLPNQKGDFALMKELSFDCGIPEIIKDNLALLNADIRAELRNTRIFTANKENTESKVQINHPTRKPPDAYTQLNTLLKDAKSEVAAHVAVRQACIFTNDGQTPLIRETIYKFACVMYMTEKMDKVFIPTYDALIWEQSDKTLFIGICEKIAAETTVSEMTATYKFQNEQATKEWLASFSEILVTEGYESLLNVGKRPIIPNQNGEFRSKEQVYLGDKTNYELKNIAALLGYDFRDMLIDEAFAIDFPENRVINDQHIAEKIMALVNDLVMSRSETEESQEAFQRLYLWFNKYPNQSEEYFSDLYFNRHRLCSPAEIVSSIEKAATLDTIMASLGVTTVDEVVQLLRKRLDADAPPTLLPLTQEILVSLGVQSQEELVIALQDKTLSDLFGHTSVPTYEAFVFVQSMLERSKRRIREFLESLGYDFTFADDTASTIFSGVIKNGRELNIVCRPSDGEEVIFYFGSEKDTLEELETELWIENGRDTPELLTLGRILKSNGIIKVKVN